MQIKDSLANKKYVLGKILRNMYYWISKLNILLWNFSQLGFFSFWIWWICPLNMWYKIEALLEFDIYIDADVILKLIFLYFSDWKMLGVLKW